MLGVYLLTLGVSSGFVGLFARQFLADQGYVPGFMPGILLAIGMGAAFAAAQLGFVAFLRLLWPPKTSAPLLPECISQLMALALLPYLAHIEVTWPDAILYKVEPLIYLGAFAVPHTLLKFVTVFSFLRSLPGRRWTILWWGGAAGVSAFVAVVALFRWEGAVEIARPKAPPEIAPYHVGNEYAIARVVPEGSVVESKFQGHQDAGLTLRWANLPEVDPSQTMSKINVTIELNGDTRKTVRSWVNLRQDAWKSIYVAAKDMPTHTTSYSISWLTAEAPKWQSLARLRPAILSGREILLSGPFDHTARAEKSPPNIVLIAVENLGANDVTGLGTKRTFTPALSRWAEKSVSFTRAYTSAPESPAACMTLLTGLSPLRHGYFGGQKGPLAKRYATLFEVLRPQGYATAAFTEGDRFNDLIYGSGFERGAEVFDSTDPPEENEPTNGKAIVVEPATVNGKPVSTAPPNESYGCQATFERALAWIDDNPGVPFCVFVRISELHGIRNLERYHVAKAGASDRELYEAALSSVDRQLGAFLTQLRQAHGTDTMVVLTGTGGYSVSDTSAPPTAQTLGESSVHVPLFIEHPGAASAQRTELVSLEDIAPTIAALAETKMGSAVANTNMLIATANEEPVSMSGEPLVLSLRSDRWRFFWETKQGPFTSGASEGETTVLYDLSHWRPGAGLANMSGRYGDMVVKWINTLRRYRDLQNEEWRTPAR